MFRKLILAIVPLIMLGALQAQEIFPDSLVRYTGYVLQAPGGSAVANAHILNLTRGTGTVSSLDGSFELHVYNLDTLKISCIGLRDQYYFINTNIQLPKMFIYLIQDTVMMKEVRISPMPPRQFFRYVFLDTKVPMPEEPQLNLGFRLGNDPAYVPPTGINFTGPVQALYNTFNKQARLNRKLRKNRARYSKYLVPVEGDSLVYPGK